MKEIYHEIFKAEDYNADVAHRIAEIIQQYNPSDCWKVGDISYEVGQRLTKLSVPLSKYDEPLDEITETYTVEKDRADEKIISLVQDGYTGLQTIPSGDNVIIVATKERIKNLERK